MRFLCTLVATILVALPLCPKGSHADVAQKTTIYRQILGSTAVIRCEYTIKLPGTFLEIRRKPQGTAWVVDKKNKLLITNHHVVGNSEKAEVQFPIFKNQELVAEKSAYKDEPGQRGKVLDVDRKRDLAIVQLTDPLPPGVDELKLAAKSPRPGEKVHSVGNPGASDAYFGYTFGTVRIVYRMKARRPDPDLRRVFQRDTWVVDTQSPLNPGDSGGPLVNDAGEVVGVVSSGTVFHGGKPVNIISHCIEVREVRALLERARKFLEPKTASDFVLRAQSFYDRELWDRAIEDCSAALNLDPKWGPAYRLRAEAFSRKGDYDTALEDCNDAVKIDEKDADAYEHRGWVYDRKENFDKAIQDFTKAIRLNVKFARAYNNRAVTYFKKAGKQQSNYSLELNTLKQAVQDANSAVQFDSNQTVYLTNRGDINFMIGKALRENGQPLKGDQYMHDSYKDIKKAIDLDPFNSNAWKIFLQIIAIKTRNLKLVLKFLDDSYEANSRDLDFLLYYARALEELLQFRKAEGIYQEMIDLQPDLKKQLSRYHRFVRIVNNTGETLQLAFRYETQIRVKATGEVKFAWYPSEPGKNILPYSFNLAAGSSTVLIDPTDHSLVRARRIRIIAQSKGSGKVWNKFWNNSMWLCPVNRDGPLPDPIGFFPNEGILAIFAYPEESLREE